MKLLTIQLVVLMVLFITSKALSYNYANDIYDYFQSIPQVSDPIGDANEYSDYGRSVLKPGEGKMFSYGKRLDDLFARIRSMPKKEPKNARSNSCGPPSGSSDDGSKPDTRKIISYGKRLDDLFAMIRAMPPKQKKSPPAKKPSSGRYRISFGKRLDDLFAALKKMPPKKKKQEKKPEPEQDYTGYYREVPQINKPIGVEELSDEGRCLLSQGSSQNKPMPPEQKAPEETQAKPRTFGSGFFSDFGKEMGGIVDIIAGSSKEETTMNPGDEIVKPEWDGPTAFTIRPREEKIIGPPDDGNPIIPIKNVKTDYFRSLFRHVEALREGGAKKRSGK